VAVALLLLRGGGRWASVESFNEAPCGAPPNPQMQPTSAKRFCS